MKKILMILIVLVGNSFIIFAQEEAGVKACINNYLEGITKGDTSKLNKAFHNQAMLRTINAGTGKMVEFPVKTFITKTPTGGVQATSNLKNYSLIGQAAFATVELAFADFKYVDYLSMLKIGNDWKIVCRVFSKADLTAEPTTFGMTATASTGKKTTVKSKPKSDDGW